MKKSTKFLCAVGVGAVAGAALSFAKDYRTMKKMQEKMDKLPVNKIKKKLAKIHREEDKTVIEVPQKMVLAEKLRVCAAVLKG